MSARRVLVAAIGAALLVLALPAAALAETVPALHVSQVDWAAGTVTVSAAYPAGTESVDFSAGEAVLGTVDTDPAADGSCLAPAAWRLTADTVFRAVGRDAAAAELWSVDLKVALASYVPAVPAFTFPERYLLRAISSPGAYIRRPITRYKLTTAPEPMTLKGTCSPAFRGTLRITDVRVPYGKQRITLTVANGFGVRSSVHRVVFQLGALSKLPSVSPYSLVDKRWVALFYVKGRNVVRDFPVAVGTPYTPTPEGYFKIGHPEPASGPWGILRRPLYRFSGEQLWATGYYIHGTNEPWSIGTWASHGCVRMYNSGISAYSRVAADYTLVLIR